MASIVELRPGHAVRRPPPRKWSPDLFRAMFPTMEGDDLEPYQLKLLPETAPRRFDAGRTSPP